MNNLIERAKQRDAEAFTQLMQSQMQNMYKTARALLSNEEDAADAISDTILSCWEKLDQLQEPSYFRTWMTRILINKCRDLQRRSARFYPAEEVPEQAEADRGFANVEWNEVLLAVDEKYRLVLMLYYVDGYKTSEISQILEIPESTVRTRLARGRERLAQICGETKKSKKDGQCEIRMMERTRTV